MALFALWVIVGFMCVLSQLQATEVAERFNNDWVSLLAMLLMVLVMPALILAGAVYASLEIL